MACRRVHCYHDGYRRLTTATGSADSEITEGYNLLHSSLTLNWLLTDERSGVRVTQPFLLK